MQIVGHEFTEITKGLYLSEDKKGIVLDIYDFTGIVERTSPDQIENALFKGLRENLEALGEEVECVIFKSTDPEKDKLCIGGLNVNASELPKIFPKMNTLLSDFSVSTGDLPKEIRYLNTWELYEMGLMAEETQGTEKAEYYIKWGVEIDYYWGSKHYGDYLWGNKRYAEAKEWFLKIAGPDDISGDGNSHLFQLLLDMGEYEEALIYYDYVLNCSDTSPAEGAVVRFETEILHPESGLWAYIEDYRFDDCLQSVEGKEIGILDDDYWSDEYVQRGTFDLEKYLEPILIMRANSNNETISKNAKKNLYKLYTKGIYKYYDVDESLEFPKLINFEKAKEYAPASGDLRDPDNPFWQDLDFNDFCEWLRILDIDDVMLIQKILVNRSNSGDDDIRKDALQGILEINLSGTYCINLEFNHIDDRCWFGKETNEYFDIEKVIEASILFAEKPKCINYIVDARFDDPPFWRLDDYIEKNYDEEDANKYRKRIIEVIYTHAEKLENVDEVTEELVWFVGECYDGENKVSIGYIPKGASAVSEMMVGTNEELEEIVIPNTIKKIHGRTFYRCYNLKSITLPNTIEKIASGAFDSCVALNSVKIPSSVSEIGSFAFSGCSSLESIVIPKSVVQMEEYVFDGCDSLATIYCEAEEKPDGWYDEWLDGCDAEVIWGYKK